MPTAVQSLGDERASKKTKTSIDVEASTLNGNGVTAWARDEPWRTNLRGDKGIISPRESWWWTGVKPSECPGFLKEGYLTSISLPDVGKVTRKQTLEYFKNTWTTTEVLFSALAGEEPFYRPPYHELRHPLIFYYGHPAVFYINKLRVAGLIPEGIDEHFESIFEVGVDEMSWDDLSKNDMDWPSIREVNEYRRKAFAKVTHMIETHPALDEKPVLEGQAAWALFMAFEHERIHIETSSVLMRELPVTLVEFPLYWPPYHPSAVAWAGAAEGGGTAQPPQLKNLLIPVPAGDITIGKERNWASFGWDNEYGERSLHIRAFQASKFKVTNAEYYAFVKAGGYRTHSYWTTSGWQWRTFRNAKWPTFWVPDGPEGLHKYKLRLAFDVVPMAWTLPADVNLHEAQAFCSWKNQTKGESEGKFRIMTEGEHHRLRDPKLQALDPVMHLNLDSPPSVNSSLLFSSSSAVDALPPSAAGFHDVFGNVWEWCEDHFSALQGFKVHPLYDDFSTPCFDGQHNIIMGGSWASSGDLASVFARYHFRPHFFQHAGFRLIHSPHQPVLTSMDAPPPYAAGWVPPSADPSKAKESVESSSTFMSQMLQMHYDTQTSIFSGPADCLATPLCGMTRYPERLACLVTRVLDQNKLSKNRALDVGCAVGGTCFELARFCPEVLGIDQSASLLEAANSIRDNGKLTLFRQDEGELGSNIVAVVDSSVNRDRVSFKQMDAMCLSPALGEFDLVVVSQLIEKLISPKALLGRLGGPQGVVCKGGVVALASTFSWNPSTTPRDLWLGGREHEGEDRYSRLGLEVAMGGGGFKLLHEENMPLVRRINARKFEVAVTNITIWQRLP
mmetsp:Transcript_28049/g.38774  ORF Transcript_28049/g.38774 Transcript_28049/m.38774 type:complete len:844 (-) Transcript_28049:435-2966(-)|eukprot:CAMPEP_0196575216 /NCGR_PEP_ID=MMETSP1081-20130531/4734_1 /TAXON_ID=36882 /ORGANISM="Pyramimonas amylifera, Strain CCMP720" /LENGTH=843 /DNA_ID=CAMNT_0041893445 /DNA_START=143 /DNA_END=2674 /DNA_ORIENTATION=+